MTDVAGWRVTRHGERPTGHPEDPVASLRPRQQVRRADESGDEGRGGTPVDVEGFADLLDPSGVHHDDQIRHRHRFALIVRDHDRRDPELLLEEPELDLQLFPQVGVERRQRLVQQEEPRLQRERPGGRHPLALSARELRDPPVGETLQ